MERGLKQFGLRAPNFIADQARARLAEVVAPAQEKLKNSLNVDRYPAILYLKKMSSSLCTCQYTHVDPSEVAHDAHDPERSNIELVIPGTTQQQDEDEIILDYGRPLYGDFADYTKSDVDPSSYDIEDDDISLPSIDSPDCGICYKTGFVPGFDLYGFRRFVFTTYDIEANAYININRADKPNTINCLTDKSYVEFNLEVPKYFKDVRYSIRNNYDILDDKLWFASSYLTLQDLINNRGKNIAIRCKARQFTHIDVTFDLGTDVLYVNFPQFAKVTDWTTVETIGNISCVFPTRIPELLVGSYMVLPSKHIVVKITDVNYLREHDENNINWETTCRVLQPQEAAKSINKSFKLL